MRSGTKVVFDHRRVWRRWASQEETDGPSGFGFSSTAVRVTKGIDASELVAIVPRATSGIGMETSRVLSLRGATVIMTARSMEKGQRVRSQIMEQIPNAQIKVMELDLSSMDSVKSFAAAFLATNHRLHILINNAGIFGCPFWLSKDGIELMFATHHIGHFLLTDLLLDRMKVTARETGIEGRIVMVSSVAHKFTPKGGILCERINDPSVYDPFTAYAQSKLAIVLHANELSRRLQEEGVRVTANSLHPGEIPTDIDRHSKCFGIPLSWIRRALSPVLPFFVKTIHQGAATTCYVALHPHLAGVSGKYFSDCNEEEPSAYALDADLAKRLWQFSQEGRDNTSSSKYLNVIEFYPNQEMKVLQSPLIRNTAAIVATIVVATKF